MSDDDEYTITPVFDNKPSHEWWNKVIESAEEEDEETRMKNIRMLLKLVVDD